MQVNGPHGLQFKMESFFNYALPVFFAYGDELLVEEPVIQFLLHRFGFALVPEHNVIIMSEILPGIIGA